jgi:hypothetical protein
VVLVVLVKGEVDVPLQRRVVSRDAPPPRAHESGPLEPVAAGSGLRHGARHRQFHAVDAEQLELAQRRRDGPRVVHRAAIGAHQVLGEAHEQPNQIGVIALATPSRTTPGRETLCSPSSMPSAIASRTSCGSSRLLRQLPSRAQQYLQQGEGRESGRVREGG